MRLTDLDSQLIDLLPVAAYLCEAPSGRLLRFNRRAVELWGREPQLGDTAEVYCGSVRLYDLDGKLIPHADCPMAAVLRTGEPIRDGRMVVERPDGTRLVVEANVIPLRGAAGQILAAVATFRDITTQYHAELRRGVHQSVAAILAEARSVTKAAPALLATLSRLAPWDCGAFWLPRGRQEELRCVAFWRSPSAGCNSVDEINRGLASHPGEGLIGTVYATGRPRWIPDLTRATEFRRLQLLAETGLRAVFAFPLALGDRCYGVVEFFSRVVQEPDDDLVRTTAALGILIGQFVQRQQTEQQWRRDRERTRLVTQATHEVLYDWDMVPDRGLWDGAMEPVFGYPLSEAGTQFAWWEERIHPEDRDRVLQRLHAWFRAGGPNWSMEYRFRRRDGSYAVVSDRAYGVRDKQGRVVRVLGAVTDISGRHREEEERDRLLVREQTARAEAELLSRRLERRQRVTEAALGHLPLAEVQQEMLHRVCEVLEVDTATLLLCEGDELVAHASAGLEAEDDLGWRTPLGQGFAGQVAVERRLLRRERIDPRDLCTEVRRRRGVISVMGAPLLLRGALIGVLSLGSLQPRRFSDEEAHLLELIAETMSLALDQSRVYEDERHARERAETAERRLEFLAEVSRVLTSSLDYEAVLEQMARQVVPFLGDWCLVDVLEPEGPPRRVAVSQAHEHQGLAAVLRRYPPDLQSQNPSARVIRSGRPLLQAEVPETKLLEIARDPEHEKVVRQLGPRSYLCVPLAARGRVLGALTLVSSRPNRRYGPEDLSLAEELARRAALALDNARLFRDLRLADENKNHFLAMLGHELRNPLAPIRNAVQVLALSDLPDPRLRRAVDTIKRQVQHEARLIDDLLNVSRIAQGKLLLRFELLDFRALVQSVVEDHQPPLEQAGLTFRVELPEAPLWVRGDPTRLAQAIGNLLHNALKFTDPGGTITLKLHPENDYWAVLTIRDTGIGIEREMLPRLFHAFSQADRTLARSQGGLGLGLALVRGLAEMHGGEVRAASEGPGRGAEFTLRLPREPAPATSATPGTGMKTPAVARRRRVLVIEDNRDTAETLLDLLELLGHESEVALDGERGLELVRSFRPDVVLCDIGLPGISGYDVAAVLRRDPATAGLQLIAVSGYGQAEDTLRTREAGFDHHLVKPVEPDHLVRLLGAASAGDTLGDNSPSEAPSETTPPACLLLVEDSPDVRESLAEVLREKGYRVVPASDGQVALNYLRTSPPPAVILLDLMMPVMNGWTFLGERQEDIALSQVPVIVITAAEHCREQMLKLGATECLPKPIDLPQLLHTLARYCPHPQPHHPTPEHPSKAETPHP